MTEDEAKTKWCPFSRVAVGSGAFGEPPLVGWNRKERESFGHREKIGGENHCIASRCMAWRWDTTWVSAVHEGQGGDTVLRLKPIKEGQSPQRGYCGLAGSGQDAP